MRSASVVGCILVTALVTFVGGFACGQAGAGGAPSVNGLEAAGGETADPVDADAQACGQPGQSCCFNGGGGVCVLYKSGYPVACIGTTCQFCGIATFACCPNPPHSVDCIEPGQGCLVNGLCGSG
jgi:hypothetical protein